MLSRNLPSEVPPYFWTTHLSHLSIDRCTSAICSLVCAAVPLDDATDGPLSGLRVRRDPDEDDEADEVEASEATDAARASTAPEGASGKLSAIEDRLTIVDAVGALTYEKKQVDLCQSCG